MPHEIDPETVALAERIGAYIEAHPNAADTIEGISWWYMRQEYEEALPRLQGAIEYLLDTGKVVERELAGRVIYQASRQEKPN